jgi:hypothetical protein
MDVKARAMTKAQRNFNRSRQPIDRNDSDYATGHEPPGSAGHPKVVVVRVRHDEAADDEEYPDAQGAHVIRNLFRQLIGRRPFRLPRDRMS